MLKDNNYSLEEKAKLAGDHIKASASMGLNEAKYTAKNIVNDAAETTKLTLEAAAIPLVIEGVYNLIQVADGKKDFDEAAAEMGLLTTSIVVKANAVSLVTAQLTNIMKDSAVQVFKDIVNANIIGQIVTVSAIVGNSVIKLINGELTGEQFFNEIGRQGVELIGGSIGAVAGQLLIPIPVVGAMVGSVVISGVCGMVYNVTTSILKAAATLDDYKKREREIAALSAEALNEINRQNKVVKELIENQFGEWDLSFNKGFELIVRGAVNFDVETIASGLDSILNVFGEKVRFSTRDEFDNFFDDDDSVFVF